MTKTQKFTTLPLLGILMLAGGGIAGYAGLVSAQSTDGGQAPTERGMFNSTPRAGGEITAINGTTITVSGQRKGGSYTIETSGATFSKDGEASNLAAFAVGDTVMAEGTLSGTTLTATKVFGGMPQGGKGGMGGPGGHGRGAGVMGEVTGVDGNTITVTGKNGQTYTVEAGSATVQKMVTGSLSDIAVGDTIGVQGAVSGTSVTASTIMDDMPEKASTAR